MAEATDNHTPEMASAALYELEDVWLNAFAQLPDGKPLADLFRDYATPMPAGARDQLAELLNPGDPDICGGRLVYTPTDGIRRAVDEWLPLAISYRAEADRLKKAGERDPSQTAAELVGEKTRQSDRSVFRKWRAWRGFIARLRGSS